MYLASVTIIGCIDVTIIGKLRKSFNVNIFVFNSFVIYIKKRWFKVIKTKYFSIYPEHLFFFLFFHLFVWQYIKYTPAYLKLLFTIYLTISEIDNNV